MRNLHTLSELQINHNTLFAFAIKEMYEMFNIVGLWHAYLDHVVSRTLEKLEDV